MEKSLQQRLIGAILLVALGVIFIPVLLDGSGFKSRHSRSIEMPPEPEYPPLSEIKLKPVEPAEVTKKPVKDKLVIVASQTAKTKPEKKTELNKSLKAFALQVSTVKVKDNAYKLRDKLRKAGYTAYVETYHKGGQPVYRVRIGPELDRARLEKMKQRIKQEQGLDGFIVNHP